MNSQRSVLARLLPWLKHPAPAAAAALVLIAFLGWTRLAFLGADPDTGITWAREFLTDEGWHASNAIRHFHGRGWLNADHNHILLMPVVPLLQAGLFQAFGLSLVTLRLPAVLASFALVAMVCALLHSRRPCRHNLSIIVCLALAATNYYFFIYSRVGFLEMPMCALGLLGMLCAKHGAEAASPARASRWFAGAAAALTLALLTKPSAVLFLLALSLLALALPLLHLPAWRRSMALTGLTVTGSGLLYVIILAALPGLFHATASQVPTSLVTEKLPFDPQSPLASLLSILRHERAARHNPLLVANRYLFAIALLLMAMQTFRLLRGRPVPLADVQMGALAVAAYVFLGFFEYQPPRYFVVLLLPLFYFVAAAFAPERSGPEQTRWDRAGRPVLLGVIVALAGLGNASRVADYLQHPAYTLREASRAIRERIRDDSPGRPMESVVLYGAVGSTFAIESGLPFEFTGPPPQGRQYLLYPKWNVHPERPPDPGPSATLLGEYRFLDDHPASAVYLYRFDPP